MIWTSELLEIYQKLGELPFKRDKKLSYLLGDTKENFVSPYYRGNNMLKAPNLNFELTEDELKNTLVYKSDKVRFIEESSNSGINPVLRKHQKDIIKDLDNRFNILHVSRQIGATFTIAFDLLHYLMFNSSKSVVVFCPKKSNCSEFYDIVFTHYKSLPFYLKKGIKSYKSGEKIVFDDNSRVFFKSSINGGIGFQIDYLILSDFAYIKDGNNLQSQLFPMLFALNDSRILVYSVGHKDTMNHFNLMVDRYNNQTMSLWNLSTYPYYCMGFSDSFPSNKISSIGEESFMIEYECLLPGSKQFLRHQKLKQLNI